MIAVALAAEAQNTEQIITVLILLLLVIAVLLTALTVWYWRHTSPKRRRQAIHQPQVNLNVGHNVPSAPYVNPPVGYQGGGPSATRVQPILQQDAPMQSTGGQHRPFQ